MSEFGRFDTYDEAVDKANEQNGAIGLSMSEAVKIVLSTMF